MQLCRKQWEGFIETTTPSPKTFRLKIPQATRIFWRYFAQRGVFPDMLSHSTANCIRFRYERHPQSFANSDSCSRRNQPPLEQPQPLRPALKRRAPTADLIISQRRVHPTCPRWCWRPCGSCPQGALWGAQCWRGTRGCSRTPGAGTRWCSGSLRMASCGILHGVILQKMSWFMRQLMRWAGVS